MSLIRKTKIINLLLLCTVIIIYSFVGKTESVNVEKRKQPIYRVDKQEKEVAITFDVNWADNDYLYEILDILDKYDVKATFFVMGKWVIYPEGNVEKLKEIHERGHEIGNHSYVHPNFTRIDNKRIEDEIRKTEKIIQESIGIKTELFRFPSGAYAENSLNVVESLGYKSIHWDVDSVDWKQLGLEKEYSRVIKNVQPGSIMLFHNNGKNTPKNLEKLIPELKNQGYLFTTVTEMIYKENYEVDNEGIQRLTK